MASDRQRIMEERLRKRRKNLFKRIDEIGKKHDCDMYFLMRKRGKGKLYEYDNVNVDDTSWPTSKQELAKSYPVPIRMTPQDFIEGRIKKQGSKTRVSKAGSIPKLRKPPLPKHLDEKEKSIGTTNVPEELGGNKDG